MVVVKESKSDNGNHTINQIEPINGPIGCIADDKQRTSSPLSRRPPHPHPPSSPTTAAILPAELLSGHRGLCTLLQISSTFGRWQVGGKRQTSSGQAQRLAALMIIGYEYIVKSPAKQKTKRTQVVPERCLLASLKFSDYLRSETT
ncbi:hypothetical protein B0H13DRAFT_1865667 [Mycena leptocephala]|nr:hypothetical protein B0H13DRAFT_1865667 [Mycena leptocephala]